MTQVFDLGPAARRVAALVAGVGDDQLGAPTPCGSYSIEILLDHIEGLSRGFTAAARKELGALTSAAPRPEAGGLGADWRTRIPARLDELARAWQAPEAWDGTTEAGGVELPGAVAGRVVVDELVLHGWDLARSSGQPFDCDDASVAVATEFVLMVAPPGQPRDPGLFGPEVAVPAGASPLDRLLGLSGRDPSWTPPGAP